MTFRRLFWRLAYWPAIAAHRLFGASYKWVNYGYGAWRRDLFDPLWHYEKYGDPIYEIPRRTSLRGCGYDVQCNDEIGEVKFISSWPSQAFTFTRSPWDPHADLWYVEVTHRRFCVSHIEEAYRWVCAVYGGSFEKKTPLRK